MLPKIKRYLRGAKVITKKHCVRGGGHVDESAAYNTTPSNTHPSTSRRSIPPSHKESTTVMDVRLQLYHFFFSEIPSILSPPPPTSPSSSRPTRNESVTLKDPSIQLSSRNAAHNISLCVCGFVWTYFEVFSALALVFPCSVYSCPRICVHVRVSYSLLFRVASFHVPTFRSPREDSNRRKKRRKHIEERDAWPVSHPLGVDDPHHLGESASLCRST